MTQLSTSERRSEPIALGDRAIQDLRFIRRVMERDTAFTAVPGWGMVAMGVTALVAATIAERQTDPEGWLAVWLVEAVVALGVGGWAIARKARRAELSLLSGTGRKFLLSFLPAALAGAALTAALIQMGAWPLIPGAWLLLYGVAVVTAGTFSVEVVPVMGFCFMLVGGAALFAHEAWGNFMMALGFGGLQVLFGLVIARKYGG